MLTMNSSEDPEYSLWQNQESEDSWTEVMFPESQDSDYISRLKKEYQDLLDEATSLESHHGALQMSITDALKSYISAGGCYRTQQIINTCVLDTLLYVLRNCHSKYESIQELFRCDRTINAIMNFLHMKQYNKAKTLWLIQLNLISDNCKFDMRGVIDVWSEVEDHLPMFNDLVCARYHYDENRASPSVLDEIHQCTLRAFECYGDVKILGLSPTDPRLILVNVNGRGDRDPPLHITDEHGRTFDLQFLLLCDMREPVNHMTGCSKLHDKWVHYDNNPGRPRFREFNIKDADFLNQFAIHLAGYVKTPRAGDEGSVPLGVLEDGTDCGTRPFNNPMRSPSATRPVKLKQL